MEGWEAWHQLPEHITLPALKAELELVEKTLVPASRAEMAVGVAKLLDFARAFKLTDAEGSQVRAMAEFYSKALEDVPGDLVVLASERASREWRWGNRMPLPAELKALIAEDLGKRRVVQQRIRSAMMKARIGEAPPRPPTPEEKARAAEIVKAWRNKAKPDDEDREMTSAELERRRAEILAQCAELEKSSVSETQASQGSAAPETISSPQEQGA